MSRCGLMPMSDVLLPYYDRELTAVRRLAGEFARRHPKIAGRLRLAPDAVDDPHVARLLEGVAFLGARVQHRLDDEFPELTDALLGVLYPHYLAPFPSCCIVQFTPSHDLAGAAILPRGLELETEPVRGETCRFRTAAPVALWPIEVESVRLSGLPLAAPANPQASGAASILRIALRCTAPGLDFATLAPDRLRFFIRGAPNVALPLHQLLGAHVVAVAVAEGPADPAPGILPSTAIEPVGFGAEEALLPWPARSFSGFRLLSEYFAFPQKFLFFDIAGLAQPARQLGDRMEIFIWLDHAVPELERAVEPHTLALGCAPAVNLFAQRCEPIPLTHTAVEYRVVPDVRRQSALEMWDITQVRESRADGSERAWQPFYRLAHPDIAQSPHASTYQAVRRDSTNLSGTELFLAPCDPDFDANRPADAVLSVDALCLNRDLPSALPFGGGHPLLRPVEGAASIARAACLTAPTPTLRPPLREKRFWRLVSHLALGHLSVVGGESGAAALQEVLRLYDLQASPETRAAIEALTGVESRPGTARVPGARPGSFCRGLDVTLRFDAGAWQGGGPFLLASILDRFLALHATVNAFVRTSVALRGRAEPVKTWPARAGARVLL